MFQRRIALKKTLFLLPSMITLSSIFCGLDSIHVAASAAGEDDYYRSALLIVFAMFFDMLDGRVARMTKTQTAFGLQLDSLADVVSFGCAPSVLVYQWTLHRLAVIGLLASFVFTACGAIRLARFNVLSVAEEGKSTTPSRYILGLPIPGAAGILVSIIVTNHAASGLLAIENHVWLVVLVTLILSGLMVSTIRFRSFKDIKLNVGTARFVGFVVGSSVVVSTQTGAVFVLLWLLGCYVMLGIWESLCHLPGRLRRPAVLGHSEPSGITSPQSSSGSPRR